MQHALQTEGFNLRLRPVRMTDAAFIVWLRNLDYVKGNVGDSATNAAGQEAWLRNYFEREGDYYFIVETPGGIPLGTHGIYDVKGSSAEQGRQIIRPEVMAGVPAAMLATDLAFGSLGFSELRSTCVSTNRAVLSLHRKSGFKELGIKRSAQVIGGKPVDLVQYLLMAEDWFKVRDGLLPLAQLAGTQVPEWEKTQLGRRQPWDGPQNRLEPASDGRPKPLGD
jgi:RimJ/RimL family protein N-acetyltransferase